MGKPVIRLNTEALSIEAEKMGVDSDTRLAAMIGVSVTQVWRAKLPVNDPRYNSPGGTLIAGVMKAFDAPFEKFFFLDESLRVRTGNRGDDCLSATKEAI